MVREKKLLENVMKFLKALKKLLAHAWLDIHRAVWKRSVDYW